MRHPEPGCHAGCSSTRLGPAGVSVAGPQQNVTTASEIQVALSPPGTSQPSHPPGRGGELVRGDAHQADRGYRQEQELCQPVTAVHALLHRGHIIHQKLYGAAIIGVDHARMYRESAPKYRTASKDLAIPTSRNLHGEAEIHGTVFLRSEDVIFGHGNIKASIRCMGFARQNGLGPQ